MPAMPAADACCPLCIVYSAAACCSRRRDAVDVLLMRARVPLCHPRRRVVATSMRTAESNACRVVLLRYAAMPRFDLLFTMSDLLFATFSLCLLRCLCHI